MKIILLMIPSIIRSARTPSNQTYHITKEASRKLNDSLPLFKNISNVKTTLHLNMNHFKDIKNIVWLTGEISKNYLHVNFSNIENLDQLNNFNKEISPLENIRDYFLNIVISLINQIFQSIPEEDVEISNESNCLMRWLKMNNPNKITISVTHECSLPEISFTCNLEEDSKNIEKTSNPNEKEEEVSKLLDKKEQQRTCSLKIKQD